MNRPPAVDAARRVAYATVLAVETDRAYANLLLPRLLRESSAEERDAAFATEIAYGTLRWQGVLDQVLAHGSTRPVEALDPQVRAVLRTGAYQLLRMRVPAHAAVHASVQLARAVVGERVAGFVNAVLRRVAERDWAGWVEELAPQDSVGRLAFAAGSPRWVAQAMADALDGDLSQLEAALAEDRPVTHLVARPGRITRDELLAAAGPHATPAPWSPFAVRLAGGDPAAVAPVREGRAAVQDEGSQLAALVLARAGEAAEGERWLDICAGPGGKAALLAGLLPAGGRLLAADLHPHRARLVAGAVSGAAADVVTADGTRPPWRPGTFDRVLVDVPCTGLGALRRRPEVRWRRQPADVVALASLQERLLVEAIDSARPGGLVAYVTCSPHPAETRAVVERAIAARPSTERVDARLFLPELPDLGPGPDVQLWPHLHGTDAMYLALLRSGVSPGSPDP
ncbi:MAG: rRNA (cytosine967-C5)-methyltransferase [Actinomycetota bacterium]|nr:rRNA (cytosine967-C5)-methyltransferase [Actinomycetota bacterium]